MRSPIKDNWLKGFGVWAVLTCSPPLILALLGDPTREVSVRDIVIFFFPFLLIPAVGSTLLWLPDLGLENAVKALAVGISFGLVAPILGGFVYMKIYPGFEEQVGIFVGSLFTAGFSAIGGGVAGWLRSKAAQN